MPSFECSRKIASTTSLRKARRGRDLSPLSYLIQYKYPRTLKSNIYYSNKRVPLPFVIRIQSCVRPRSDSFFWQNRCSGYNSGIDLVVAVGYTFFQFCSNAEQISARLVRLRRIYVKRAAVVLTSHTSYITFLLDVLCAVQSDHVPLFGAVCPRW